MIVRPWLRGVLVMTIAIALFAVLAHTGWSL